MKTLSDQIDGLTLTVRQLLRISESQSQEKEAQECRELLKRLWGASLELKGARESDTDIFCEQMIEESRPLIEDLLYRTGCVDEEECPPTEPAPYKGLDTLPDEIA